MRGRAPRRLSAEQIEGIVAMFHARLGAAEIGKAYRVSAQTIQYQLAKRGLRYRRRGSRKARLAGEMRRGRIHLLRGQGFTLARMAADLGMTLRALRKWMHARMPDLYAQMKVEEKRPGRRMPRAPKLVPRTTDQPAPFRPRLVVRHYQQGFSITAIARHYNWHPQRVLRVLRAHGVGRRPRLGHSPMWLRAHRKGRP